MSYFSCLEIKPFLFCPYCGEKHYTVQTKEVDSLKLIKVGDKVKYSSNNKRFLILKDEFHCFGTDCSKNRAILLNLGKQTIYPKGDPYNTTPMYYYACFDKLVYKGTVLNLDDALTLLNNPEEEEIDYFEVY